MATTSKMQTVADAVLSMARDNAFATHRTDTHPDFESTVQMTAAAIVDLLASESRQGDQERAAYGIAKPLTSAQAKKVRALVG